MPSSAWCWRASSGRLIATFLFGVDPLDPLTFVSVPVVILLTAIVAAAAPAWRASRINPVDAFRHGRVSEKGAGGRRGPELDPALNQ